MYIYIFLFIYFYQEISGFVVGGATVLSPTASVRNLAAPAPQGTSINSLKVAPLNNEPANIQPAPQELGNDSRKPLLIDTNVGDSPLKRVNTMVRPETREAWNQ